MGTLKVMYLDNGDGTGLNISGTIVGRVPGASEMGDGAGRDESEDEEDDDDDGGRSSRGGGLWWSGLTGHASNTGLGWTWLWSSLGRGVSLESGVFGSGLTNSGMGTVTPPKHRPFLVASGDAGDVVGSGGVVHGGDAGGRGGGGGGERGGGIGGRGGGGGGKDW